MAPAKGEGEVCWRPARVCARAQSSAEAAVNLHSGRLRWGSSRERGRVSRGTGGAGPPAKRSPRTCPGLLHRPSERPSETRLAPCSMAATARHRSPGVPVAGATTGQVRSWTWNRRRSHRARALGRLGGSSPAGPVVAGAVNAVIGFHAEPPHPPGHFGLDCADDLRVRPGAPPVVGAPRDRAHRVPRGAASPSGSLGPTARTTGGSSRG